MQKLFILILLITAHGSFAKDYYLSYLSLNNEKEFPATQSFFEKLNKNTLGYHFYVREFLNQGENPKKAFEKMLKDTKPSHGLVISGHHTKGFEGKRSSWQELSISDIEEFSCQPKYFNRFLEIRALWLQGCRTHRVTLNNQTSETKSFENFEKSFDNVNLNYSEVIDEGNPLSLRFSNSFLKSYTFGWSEMAPGEQNQSSHSLPFHIAHLASRLNKGDLFENPLDSIWKLKTTNAYAKALAYLLSGEADREKSQYPSLAWTDHGNGEHHKYAYNNPHLKGTIPYSFSDEKSLKDFQKLYCELKSKPTVSAVKELIEKPYLFALSFPLIYDLLLSDGERGGEIIRTLKRSKLFKDYILSEVSSDDIGLVLKVRYYTIMQRLWNLESKKIDEKLISHLEKLIKNDSGNYEFADYIQSLMLDFSNAFSKEKVLEAWLMIANKAKGETLKVLAMNYLGRNREEKALKVFIKLFSDKTKMVSQFALKAINSYQQNEITKVLHKLSKDEDPRVRDNAELAFLNLKKMGKIKTKAFQY